MRGLIKTDSSAKNEIIITKELKKLLAENPKPKLVVRVPNPPANVTEADKFNVYVNIVEKTFIQRGFTLRDRALLENILKAGTSDYRTIGEKIDTDIIIDILSLKFNLSNKVTTFFNKTRNKQDKFLAENMYVDCHTAQLECRLTIVQKGQLGGMFTFFLSPCDFSGIEFILSPNKDSLFWPGGQQSAKSLLVPIDTDEERSVATKAMTNLLIDQLLGGIEKDFARARDLYISKQYPQAFEILSELIKKDSNNFRYYVFTGAILAKQREFEKAAFELDKALMNATTPLEKAAVYYAYAIYHALKNEKEMAFSYLKKSFEGGMTNFQYVRTDEDLSSIKNSPEFERLLREYEKKLKN
jgi:hypothetical protein